MWPFTRTPKQIEAEPPIEEGEFPKPVRGPWRDYPEDFISPRNMKLWFRAADKGDTKQYQQILDVASTDYHVKSTLTTLKLSIAGQPWTVEPGEEGEASQKQADECAAWIRRFPSFRQFMIDLLDAPYRGFAVCCPWVTGKDWDVGGYHAIEARHFNFWDGKDISEVPLYESEAFPDGGPLPPGSVVHVSKDMPGPVTRAGFGRAIAKLWHYKSTFIVDLASYMERFGHPHVQVTVPQHFKEGSDEMKRAKDAARAMLTDMIGIVPEGTLVELTESISKAATVRDTYLACINWCDDSISKVATGATLTADASRTGGLGHGQEAKQHGNVAQDRKEFYATQLEETLNEQLLKPWAIHHYGDKVMPPRICIDVKEPEDEVAKGTALKLRAETIAILLKAKMPISKAQMQEEFNLEEPDGPDDELEGEPPPPPPVMPGEKPPAEPKKEKLADAPDPLSRLALATNALKDARLGGAVIDSARFTAAHPDLPITNIIED